MIILEILMVLIGLGAVVYSFQLAEDKKAAKMGQNDTVSLDNSMEEPTIAWEEKLSELREKVELLYDEVDDKMSQLSNEKIMGMSEYSDQVIDKIEKNHGEVVFLYDMMNAKQEEVQQLIKKIDEMKADIHDEAAGEFQKLKEQEKILEEIRKEIELDFLEYQSQKQEIQEEWEALERQAMEQETPDHSEISEEQPEKLESSSADSGMSEEGSGADLKREPANDSDSEDASIDTSIFDAEIARIEEEETKALLEEEQGEEKEAFGYQPLSKQDKPVNHNDEIITLYKKGRSVMDISKMLALGQGEVKFVIDLYNAR